MNTESIPYQMGQRGHKTASECFPLEDAVFMEWIEKEDPPFARSVVEYVRGFYSKRRTSHDKATARRAAFTVVK